MSDPGYLLHVTLDTGHRRRSPRAEVDPAAVTIVGQMLAEALSTGPVEIRPGYTLAATAVGAALDATVMRDGRGPLVTIGVARKSRASTRLWALVGDTGFHPPAPWCAARLHPGLQADLDAARWLGDFERCLAWAWIDQT